MTTSRSLEDPGDVEGLARVRAKQRMEQEAEHLEWQKKEVTRHEEALEAAREKVLDCQRYYDAERLAYEAIVALTRPEPGVSS